MQLLIGIFQGSFRAIFEHLDADSSGQLDMGEVPLADACRLRWMWDAVPVQVRQCLSIMQPFGCTEKGFDNPWSPPKAKAQLHLAGLGTLCLSLALLLGALGVSVSTSQLSLGARLLNKHG